MGLARNILGTDFFSNVLALQLLHAYFANDSVLRLIHNLYSSSAGVRKASLKLLLKSASPFLTAQRMEARLNGI